LRTNQEHENVVGILILPKSWHCREIKKHVLLLDSSMDCQQFAIHNVYTVECPLSCSSWIFVSEEHIWGLLVKITQILDITIKD